MKVNGSNGISSAQGSRGAAPSAAGGFSLGGAAAAAETAPMAKTAGAAPVSTIDALLALQSVGTPTERKRRAVGRAGRILDLLDDLKLSLLEDNASPDALGKLIKAVREQRDGTDDQGLEGVLNEIETRAAVELAKLGAPA